MVRVRDYWRRQPYAGMNAHKSVHVTAHLRGRPRFRK